MLLHTITCFSMYVLCICITYVTPMATVKYTSMKKSRVLGYFSTIGRVTTPQLSPYYHC